MLKNKINGKFYIGQTIRLIEKRFKAHQQKNSGCRAIYNAIKKYGWSNFEKDWYECPDEDLNFDEDLLVREMGTLAPDGYNLKEGGGNGKHSEETKQKIRKSHVGKTHTDETKIKMSEAHAGIPLSIETRQKMSEAQQGEKSHMFGKPRSDETRQKISKTLQGKTASEETKVKLSEARKGDKNYNSKRVYQYDLEGNILGSFASSGEAMRHLGEKNDTNIRRCARGEQKTAYGFKWSQSKIE